MISNDLREHPKNAEIVRLRAALDLYGWHLVSCDFGSYAKCTCGFDEALVPQKTDEGRDE